ncbi:MAG: nucleoside transporter C-terminal domain-containing protein [Candidatus Babeliales bacterium]
MVLFDYFIEHNRYLTVLGIPIILALAALFSHNRKAINYRLVTSALGLQFLIGVFSLRIPFGQRVIQSISDVICMVYQFSDSGVRFIFGNLADAQGAWGFIFAVKVLPIIIFFGALMALFFHMGIIQKVVAGIGWVIRPLLGTSGAETLCAVSNSFLGQTEAPLVVRHYLAKMTNSEMMVVMVSGMGTISGSIMAVYAAMGVPAGHMLAASVMAIPGSILIAKILYPETEKSQTAHGASINTQTVSGNALDALATGTSDGLMLALNVGAMLISFLAIIAMINALLSGGSGWINAVLGWIGIAWKLPALNLNLIFSWLFAPFGYLLGFTGGEALMVGRLIGTKVAVNELVAYCDMVKCAIPDRMCSIVTYALCGFSNFSCIGIQIGGIGALVPEKRPILAQLGLYAVLGGSLTNLLS